MSFPDEPPYPPYPPTLGQNNWVMTRIVVVGLYNNNKWDYTPDSGIKSPK